MPKCDFNKVAKQSIRLENCAGDQYWLTQT